MKDFKAAKIRLFYSRGEGENLKSRTFNNLIPEVGAEQVRTFQQAIQTLSAEDIVESSVSEEYLYA